MPDLIDREELRKRLGETYANTSLLFRILDAMPPATCGTCKYAVCRDTREHSDRSYCTKANAIGFNRYVDERDGCNRWEVKP